MIENQDFQAQNEIRANMRDYSRNERNAKSDQAIYYTRNRSNKPAIMLKREQNDYQQEGLKVDLCFRNARIFWRLANPAIKPRAEKQFFCNRNYERRAKQPNCEHPRGRFTKARRALVIYAAHNKKFAVYFKIFRQHPY